ncbi:O-antigen ligase family protein [Microbacter sp. GSS18]|nr:O-antigen ligase family protein [Microbacter sp. GSS18]
MTTTSARAAVWRARLADWWAGVWRWVLLAAAAFASAFLVLENAGRHGVTTAIAIAALLIAAIATWSQPMAMALMAMPLLLIVERVGMGGTNLSVSDAALFAAFGTAILLGDRHYSKPMRQLLWLNLVYQFATLFTVIVNPQAQNTLEWVHAWLLISGALIVGWALGRAGFARTALLLLIAGAVVIALGTVATAAMQFAGGNFGPVYPNWPWSMHKNFAGTTMAFAVIIVYINPPWARLPQRWIGLSFWLLVAAIIMTQSRQAMVSLIAAIIVVAVRKGASRRQRLALLLVIPAVWMVVTMIIEQIESQNQHNSFFQRVDWLREVYAYWKHAPFFGHGLRFWYYDRTLPYQPPQAELEVLASAGLVGLLGFVVMWVGILIVLARVNPLFGTLALAITLSRIAQSQFDLFWTAVGVSVPFVVAGLCLGALARYEREGSALRGDDAAAIAAPPPGEPATRAPARP